MIRISTLYGTALEAALFPDAEGGKDQMENVVGGGLPGERIQGPECAIEVEQDHLVGCRG